MALVCNIDIILTQNNKKFLLKIELYYINTWGSSQKWYGQWNMKSKLQKEKGKYTSAQKNSSFTYFSGENLKFIKINLDFIITCSFLSNTTWNWRFDYRAEWFLPWILRFHNIVNVRDGETMGLDRNSLAS